MIKMELARDELNGSPFDRLPVQVLEHIFLKGCDLDIPAFEHEIYVGPDNTIHAGPAYRRLKPFALDVRAVCSRWKNMIDSEEYFSLTLPVRWPCSCHSLVFYIKEIGPRREAKICLICETDDSISFSIGQLSWLRPLCFPVLI